MENQKKKWMEEVFNSLEGSQRAQPDPALLRRIEQSLDIDPVRHLPVFHWRMAAAAATLLLILNAFAMREYLQDRKTSITEELVEDQSLISDFKIYD